MVIQTLKAEIAALTEAMKEKGIPEKVMTTLKESAAGLQKLLDKAREAAKAAKAKEADMPEEEEAGKAGEEEEGEEAGKDGDHMPEPGHTLTVTHKVKHDGPKGEEADDEKEPDEDDAKEAKRGYVENLLKEAGIPKELWGLDKLSKLSLKEVKAEIAEKQALLETVRKTVEQDIEFVPATTGTPMHESNSDKTNLNGLFEGCAR